MSVQIGIIAEEQNDVDVLYEFTCKLTAENSFQFSKFLGHGCGRIRKKCKVWALNLAKRGCTHLVVMHDLDELNENKLRTELASGIKGSKFASHIILIPIYELEAWLLCDAMALRKTFDMKILPGVPGTPETIRDPKKRLRDIVWKCCKKHYINTVHNKKIAQATNIKRLSLCPSFAQYPKFVKSSIPN
ncbi:MAG: DUF4276 family protein [Dehalococcoidia bacterium]